MVKQTWTKYLAWVVVIVVVAGVITGLFLIDSPSTARKKRADAMRVDALVQIASAVNMHWANTDTLPASLQELNILNQQLFVDPFTGEPYKYEPGENGIYALCAHFNYDTISDTSNGAYDLYRQHYADIPSQNWNHTAGKHCYELDASAVEKHLGPKIPIPEVR